MYSKPESVHCVKNLPKWSICWCSDNLRTHRTLL